MPEQLIEPTRERQAAFYVAGLTVRTTSLKESDYSTGRLRPLWNRFFDEQVYASTPHRTADARLFCVFSAYDSSAINAFDMTAGVAVARGDGSVRIEPGDYLVFKARGEMPNLAMDARRHVSEYLADHPSIVRRFRTDFESYDGPCEVAIHIGME